MNLHSLGVQLAPKSVESNVGRIIHNFWVQTSALFEKLWKIIWHRNFIWVYERIRKLQEGPRISLEQALVMALKS